MGKPLCRFVTGICPHGGKRKGSDLHPRTVYPATERKPERNGAPLCDPHPDTRHRHADSQGFHSENSPRNVGERNTKSRTQGHAGFKTNPTANLTLGWGIRETMHRADRLSNLSGGGENSAGRENARHRAAHSQEATGGRFGAPAEIPKEQRFRNG